MKKSSQTEFLKEAALEYGQLATENRPLGAQMVKLHEAAVAFYTAHKAWQDWKKNPSPLTRPSGARG